MKSCTREKCPGSGLWIPTFLVHARKGDKPVVMRLPDLPQCEWHKSQGILADFLSDEGWDKIQKHMREAGKGTFVKSLTKLDWTAAPGAKESEEWLPF